MNIYELADNLLMDLILTRYPSQDGRFVAKLEHCEIKDQNTLGAEYGDGPTPLAALNDHARRISGRCLVFYAGSKEFRREFVCPSLKDLEAA